MIDWSVLIQAPIATLIILVTSFSLAFFIVNCNYRERIGSLKQRLKKREQKIIIDNSFWENVIAEVERTNPALAAKIRCLPPEKVERLLERMNEIAIAQPNNH